MKKKATSKSKSKTKAKVTKHTKLPCPECGSEMQSTEDGGYYCPKCRRERAIPGNMVDRLKMDSLPKPVRWLLVVLAAVMIVWTAVTFIRRVPAPALNVSALDEALLARGAKAGKITISILWDSADDLDLHVVTPDGEEICYLDPAVGGGVLDVDANRNSEDVYENPVENICFAQPQNGEYHVYIHDVMDRTPEGETNYLVRITAGDLVQTFHGVIDGDGKVVNLAQFTYGTTE